MKDTIAADAIANTLTIGGLLAFIMKFTPVITILVLLTGLALNIIRIYDRFKGKNNGKD